MGVSFWRLGRRKTGETLEVTGPVEGHVRDSTEWKYPGTFCVCGVDQR
jgi:hypothetical protein